LRQQYDFPRNLKRRFGVPCIWSDEPATAPIAAGACATTSDGSLNCSGLGSSMPVTAAFGLAAAAQAISAIAASG
jgi:tRNA A37 threonylcarbamoyladenosine dehydratase